MPDGNDKIFDNEECRSLNELRVVEFHNPSFCVKRAFVLKTVVGELSFGIGDPVTLRKTSGGVIVVGNGENEMIVEDTRLKRELVSKVCPAREVVSRGEGNEDHTSMYVPISDASSIQDSIARMTETSDVSNRIPVVRIEQ